MSDFFNHKEAVSFVQKDKRVLIHHNNVIVWFNPFCRDMNLLEVRAMLDDEEAGGNDIFNGKYSLAETHEVQTSPEDFTELIN